VPLFAEEASPLYAPSKNEVAQRWQKKVGEFDAFIFTAAEYNRGPTAVRSISETSTRRRILPLPPRALISVDRQMLVTVGASPSINILRPRE
jgi:hypothetical protein